MKVRFGDVASRLNIHVDQKTTNLEYYIGGEHIESREFMIHKRALIKGSTIGYQFQFGFRKNDILFMTKNPHLRKASMVDFDGLCSIATFVIHSNDESVLLQDYLLIEMQSDRFWNYLEEHKSGGVNYFINWGTLSNYEFSLPPIAEQRILADKLWTAYRLKESYKELIKATDELVKSQFIEMFGEIDVNRSQKTIKDYAQLIGGFAFKSELFKKDAIPIIRISNINNGSVDLDYDICYDVDFWNNNPTFRVEKNDILFAMSGATTGKCGIYKHIKPALLNQRVGDIRAKKGISYTSFLFMALQQDSMLKIIQAVAQGGAQPNISGKQIESLPMPEASTDMQKAFDLIYQQADKSKFLHIAS